MIVVLYQLFIQTINVSITATVVIVAVLLARAFMRRLPKKYSYFLWGIVAIRLLCPLGISSPISVFNFVGEYTINDLEYKEYNETIDVTVSNNSMEDKRNTDFENVSQEQKGERTNTFLKFGTKVWLSVGGGLLFWNLFMLFKMKRRVATAIRLKKNIYECDNIPSPFVMGILHPKIYIPFRLGKSQQEYIIEHEQYHIFRKDHVMKMLAVFLTCIYWFHPLVWVSYILMIRDMEMSCDEYVLQISSEDIRENYSKSLLEFAMNQRDTGLGVQAFGESDTRRRVKNIMEYRKYGKWIGILAVCLIVIVGAACLTDANQVNSKEQSDNKENAKLLVDNQETTEMKMQSEISHHQGNMGIDYIEDDGKYISDGREYTYKKVLTGRGNGAEKDTTFTVLTNNEDITFHDVWWSLISSNSKDWLPSTIIIDIR